MLRRHFLLASGLAQVAKSATKTPLQRLMDGNRRYAKSQLRHPDQTLEHRQKVSREQHPFAAVLSCSDSRVPPEIIFDQGLGDLFVVRNAGHVIDDAVVASLEYALGHLGVKLIVVVGHSRCGAVAAAMGGDRSAHLAALVDAIQPAIDAAKVKYSRVDPAEVVRTHVQLETARLVASPPIISKAILSADCQIVAAVYDLDTGLVVPVG